VRQRLSWDADARVLHLYDDRPFASTQDRRLMADDR
jgi:hypothetical protein